MESRIKIRGKIDDVSNAFKVCRNPNYYIKSYDFKERTQLCDVLIRHKELDKKLVGTFTLAQLEEIFSETDD